VRLACFYYLFDLGLISCAEVRHSCPMLNRGRERVCVSEGKEEIIKEMNTAELDIYHLLLASCAKLNT